MQAGLSSAREVRARYRHELRTLTYVTLDQANGGIVRNLTAQSIGVQAVAAVRPHQQVRVRFELRYPKLRVETRGEVVWSTVSGQCGIRLLDIPPRMTRQINEWIFGNLLEGSVHADPAGPMFGAAATGDSAFGRPISAAGDGLMVSGSPLKVIELPAHRPLRTAGEAAMVDATGRAVELDWLSQPLSGRSLAWIVNSLIVVAAALLFALVFLSVTREPPRWPVSMGGAMVVAVAALYWGFFKVFGGGSLGARLARLRDSDSGSEDVQEKGSRFR